MVKLDLVYRPGRGLCKVGGSKEKAARAKSGTPAETPPGPTSDTPATESPTDATIATAGTSEAPKDPASIALSPEQQLSRLKEQNRIRQAAYRARKKGKKPNE